MLDTERIPDHDGTVRPTDQYTCDNQGISAGWQDIYPKYIDCQVSCLLVVLLGVLTLLKCGGGLVGAE
jgi:hypothetical protein